MKIVEIKKNFIKFEFIEDLARVSYTTNIFALIHDSRVLLIDAGYASYAEQVKSYFSDMNLSVERIIITHYHRDHCEGSIVFPEAQVYASVNYDHTMERLLRHYNDNPYKIPDVLIANDLHLEFGLFTLHIFQSPGHTPCSISVIIDKQYLLPSDLLLQDLNRKNIIPYVDIDAHPENHLKSLRKFEILEFKEICLSHGFIIKSDEISGFMNDRIYYLERFIESHYKADLEYCLIHDKSQYAMTEIHKLNLRNGKKLNA